MYEMMRSLQEVSIKLYFDDNLYEQFKKNPFEVLKKRSINEIYFQMLPNVNSYAFDVESRGRKVLVTQEIQRRFKEFFGLYFEKNTTIYQISQSKLMSKFFKSEYFFKNEFSFPHYAGIGYGYENVSKFFLYIIQVLTVSDTDLNEVLLISLYTAMAIYLSQLAELSDVGFYQQFRSNVFFKIKDSCYVVLENKRIKLEAKTTMINQAWLNQIVVDVALKNKGLLDE